MAYQIEVNVITLSDFKVIHLLQVFSNVVFIQLCNSWQDFN